MPRLKQAGREAGSPYADKIFDLLFGDRDPIAEPGTATGTPGNWWTVFNIVPDAFDHTTEGFRFYRSPERKLSPKLRELGQIRAGYAVGSQFVFSQHCKAARDAGFTEEQVQAIPALAGRRLLQRSGTCPAGLYRRAGAGPRARAGWRVRGNEAPPQR
jgi:hypothetical protein